uniref:Salivary apyrase n=1 Tax=Sergentomyia schwetzi TaxID=114605 RepID=A0A6B9VJV1_9DIPT|nr:salivary apyrase [Sergentomyia schwetzi]
MISVKFCVFATFVILSTVSAAPRQGLDDEYGFEIIADRDKKAIGDKNTWESNMRIGGVKVIDKNTLDISFTKESFDILTKYSYNGRGAELSELIYFNGEYYTFDDKSGIIFRISNQNLIVPWVVLGDGYGNETNGFKNEWATVKDDHIYVGSHGIENLVKKTGEIENVNMQYVKRVSKTGEVVHENWSHVYNKIRDAIGMPFPGWVMHEAVVWSPINKKWIFLPRKCSPKSFLDVDEEKIGCNKMIFASEDFSTIEHLELQATPLNSERGFSSFKFLPDSQEKIIVGLTTVEAKTITTSVIAFDLQGKILFPEKKFFDDKYEGLAFFKH